MEEATKAISKILETGLLGAIVIVLGFVIVFLYKELDKSKKERLDDWQRHDQEDNKVISEVRVFMQRILDLLQQKNV